MKKLSFAAAFLLLVIAGTTAQTLPKEFVSLGLSAGKTDKLNMGSMPITFSHQIAGLPNIRYQLGLRQNLAFGATKFTINNSKVLIDDISNYSINLFAGLEYISKYKLLAGFNIDLIGGTFGTRSYKTINAEPVYAINPEGINMLLGGSNDKGSLNSEFYLGYRFNDNITLKAGVSHYLLTLEYSNSAGKGTTQSFINIPFAKIEYTLWQN
jgi:hypothetical protein